MPRSRPLNEGLLRALITHGERLTAEEEEYLWEREQQAKEDVENTIELHCACGGYFIGPVPKHYQQTFTTHWYMSHPQYEKPHGKSDAGHDDGYVGPVEEYVEDIQRGGKP